MDEDKGHAGRASRFTLGSASSACALIPQPAADAAGGSSEALKLLLCSNAY